MAGMERDKVHLRLRLSGKGPLNWNLNNNGPGKQRMWGGMDVSMGRLYNMAWRWWNSWIGLLIKKIDDINGWELLPIAFRDIFGQIFKFMEDPDPTNRD